jgi:hypothetical protein
MRGGSTRARSRLLMSRSTHCPAPCLPQPQPAPNRRLPWREPCAVPRLEEVGVSWPGAHARSRAQQSRHSLPRRRQHAGPAPRLQPRTRRTRAHLFTRLSERVVAQPRARAHRCRPVSLTEPLSCYTRPRRWRARTTRGSARFGRDIDAAPVRAHGQSPRNVKRACACTALRARLEQAAVPTVQLAQPRPDSRASRRARCSAR